MHGLPRHGHGIHHGRQTLTEKHAFGQVIKAFGGVDIVVSNAEHIKKQDIVITTALIPPNLPPPCFIPNIRYSFVIFGYIERYILIRYDARYIFKIISKMPV